MESKLRFNGTWRSYQERILKNLRFHLRDSKLHVVAAPGAGKTTLGIEIISQLCRPALILCPTNTIKNQWRERICSSFLQQKDYGIVSTNIREPQYITVTTYQALLAAFCGKNDDEAELPAEENDYADDEAKSDSSITASARFDKVKADETIKTLKGAGISLICYDEAHHLRKEWWRALSFLNEQLKPAQTVSLTATPPYDVDLGEWERYQELCGEIDEVISIPELVKNGDLCPHQDFIYFSNLTEAERQLMRDYVKNVEQFIGMVQNDTELLDTLSKRRFFKATDADVEMILESPGFYVSIASLLHSRGYDVPQKFLSLFDATPNELPKFDKKHAAWFINGLMACKDTDFLPLEEKKTHYLNMARRMGLVANKKIALNDSQKMRKLMAGSLGKLEAIVEIVRLESRQLQQRLRMVILTDRIKMDDVGSTTLGVVPIWAKLTACFGASIPFGVLCGSLILLPKDKVVRLQQVMHDSNIPAEAVTLGRFKDFDSFVRVTPKESIKNHIVRLVTDMFNNGDITVLIGTQSLLGEGWDAPAINSLILSSTVSSYMLSNQMRGRAIRIDKHHPDKVSNIWHLATVEFPSFFSDLKNLFSFESLSSDDENEARLYTSDLQQLSVRFQGFEAPSYYGKHEIASGIERILKRYSPNAMQSPEASLKQSIEQCQEMAQSFSCDREQTRRWWQEALYLGYGNNKVISGVQAPALSVKSLRYVSHKYIIVTILTVVLSLWAILSEQFPSSSSVLIISLVALIALVVLIGKVVISYLKTGTVKGIMKQIAIVILETMSSQGTIKTSLHQVGLHVEEADGLLFVSCANLPEEENNLFIRALQEFLNPIQNPRYLLIKYNKFMNRITQTDYFAVPAIISKSKKDVEILKQSWQKYIGQCDIVYTRNTDGRRILLKSRKDASTALVRKQSERLSKWQ